MIEPSWRTHGDSGEDYRDSWDDEYGACKWCGGLSGNCGCDDEWGDTPTEDDE